ncbi:hypothetical protein T439DRAFT_279820, partial [Meredithblackwellia eburnea MCA 4105]
RNIVLCFDGTSNSFDASLTNVPLLFSLLSADPNRQMNYYQVGIGEYHGLAPSLFFFHFGAQTQLLFFLVMDGYYFLVQNWRPGDRIFLFGFSRGAFTARALAGMVQQVGILLPGNKESISLAYHIYKSENDKDKWLVPPSCENKNCTDCGELLTQGFKRSFCREAKVHYVGVWDTVSSVGGLIPRTLPFAQGGGAITFFRHAIALDERRAHFPPQ